MIARTPRKLTLPDGVLTDLRDTTKPPITYANYYFIDGAYTVEIGKTGLTAGNGFPVKSENTYHDIDQSMDRKMLATGGAVTLYIEEFEA